MIRIEQFTVAQIRQLAPFDSSFVVNNKITVDISEGKISYDLIAVEPYEKTYGADREMEAGMEFFIAWCDDRPIGETCLSNI
jgi:hypothetical protein